MSKKIFRSICLIVLAVLLSASAIIMMVLYTYFTGIQKESLTTQVNLAAAGVQNEGTAYFTDLNSGGTRFTWIDSDGTVLYDSDNSASGMQNHADREEFKEAEQNGTGDSERLSETMSAQTYYHALKMSDGTVLRGSFAQNTIFTLVLGMIQPFLIIILAGAGAAAFIASRLSKRIVKPLNELDLDHPLKNQTYDELSPLLVRIDRQHNKIEKQMQELKKRQIEFETITSQMSEGLILLNEKTEILSINDAAKQLFQIDSTCIGQSFLNADRSADMQHLVQEASKGNPCEITMEKNGRVYQMDSNPIHGNDKITGICILAFDITEKQLAEQNRQEFSANVSHELKTPLHAIMGNAELFANGMVKPEDTIDFGLRIQNEAKRLVQLIEDIINLSQLDEGKNLSDDTVELDEVVKQEVNALTDKASEAGIHVTLETEPVSVKGSERLYREIIFNLMDNAIRYNRKDGTIHVEVSALDTEAVLKVSDTGIGIPEEAQSRVFERFYRVDKSHSKETGGTGLGLSIVKHAVQDMHGSISLHSIFQKGTEIEIRFPIA